MGPPENPTNPLQNQETTPSKGRKRPRRRPRTRRCLLKGCEQRFRPQQARQRYCGERCREAAREWSRWKAQERYRATIAGKQLRNGQSRRYRKRVRSRKPSEKEAVPEAARVITPNFFRGLLRPAGLLRAVRAQPEIATPAVLFQGVPTRLGACLGAGATLGRGADRTRRAGHTLPRGERSRPGRWDRCGREISATY
jgi:hypothetical protein